MRRKEWCWRRVKQQDHPEIWTLTGDDVMEQASVGIEEWDPAWCMEWRMGGEWVENGQGVVTVIW